jgi:hypothetical protein
MEPLGKEKTDQNTILINVTSHLLLVSDDYDDDGGEGGEGYTFLY